MIVRMFTQMLLWTALMGAFLFGCAGTLAWPGAWCFLLEFAVCGTWLGLWLARHDPGLLAERLAPLMSREHKRWDRVFLVMIFIGWFVWLAIMALDAVRWRASHMPLWLGGVGALLVFLDIYLTRDVFRANSFASPVVKLQPGRGHVLSDAGPYAIVRHPMYALAILLFVGTPLLLGSWWGLACVPLMIVALGWRAVMEERTLADGLPGYRAYLERVRYRFVPGVW